MTEDGNGSVREAVVLDYLPHGRADDDRPQYQKPALAHAMGVEGFQLHEVVLEEDAAVTIGDQIAVDPPAEVVREVRDVDYGDLSRGAQSELEHAVADLVEEDEPRFVEFFNEAGPISLRLHQFNLLPGIGDKLRDNILDERERDPFEDFDDLEARVSGLHDPKGVLLERIVDELRDEDVKYKLFARAPDAEQ